MTARPARVPAPRLPGTYAADHGREPDWRWGAAALGALLALAVAGETAQATFVLLSGNSIYPGTLDLLRVVALAGLGLALWMGWGWTRWPLAASAFLNGACLLMLALKFYSSPARHAAEQSAPPQNLLLMPWLFLGCLYLAGAGYLALSADVSAFLRHRQARGADWTILPLSLLTTAFAGLILLSFPLYLRWLEAQRPGAARFGEESLRAVAQRWDQADYAARADADFLPSWPEEMRKLTFGSLAPLGPLQRLEGADMANFESTLDASGGGFLVRGSYNVRRAEFAHGHAAFSFRVQRHLLGPWRLSDILVSNIEIDGAGK